MITLIELKKRMKLIIVMIVMLYVSDLRAQNQITLPDSILNIIDELNKKEGDSANYNTQYMTFFRFCSKNIVSVNSSHAVNFCSGLPYIAVFNEEFDILDEAYWNNAKSKHHYDYLGNLKYSQGFTDQTIADCVVNEDNKTKTWYQKENSTINNGVLTIKTEYDPTNLQNRQWDGQQADFNYRSGWVESLKHFENGAFVARIKLPNTDGIWPAFWLYTYLNEGHTDEIDIFEFYKNNRSTMNVNVRKDVDNEDEDCRKEFEKTNDYFESWHIYACFWTHFGIVVYVDGKLAYLLRRYHGTNVKRCGFEANKWIQKQLMYPVEPMKIIFNTAVHQCSEYIISSNNYPKSYEIDWFRIYYQRECEVDLNYTTTNEVPNHQALFNVSSGRNITINTGTSLGSNKYLKAIHSEQLTISDFEVDPNAIFEDEISSNLCVNQLENLSDIGGMPISNEKQSPISIENVVKTKLSMEMSLRLKPNPTSGGFSFDNQSTLDSQKCIVVIYNILGEQVYINEDYLIKEEIFLSPKTPNGVYTVLIYKKSANILIKSEKLIILK